jgi:hypothetical protein
MSQCLILRKKSPAFIEHHPFDFVDLTLPGLEKLRLEKTSVCIQSIFSLFGSGFFSVIKDFRFYRILSVSVPVLS